VVPSAFVNPTAAKAFGVAGEMVKVAVATTPVAIVLTFDPVTTQVTDPGFALHRSDFPLPVAAGPAVTAKLVKSTVE
jgi:hypothetical protein